MSSSSALAASSVSIPRLREYTRLLPRYDPWRGIDGSGLWFDEDAAARAVGFFHDCLVHVEGRLAGKPFILEPWQQGFIANLFGWKRADGSRRYRQAFLYVPRKNGKTPLAAGIALYVLFCDGERGAQCYCAAAETEQASQLFRHAREMIRADDFLRDLANVYESSRRIVPRNDPAAFLRVLSAKPDTKHGGNTHLVIIDELHAQRSRDLVDVLVTSMASANRRQPLLLYVSTADVERPSICNEVVQYCERMLGGEFNDTSFLPAFYRVSREDAFRVFDVDGELREGWECENIWKIANPNLGVSVSREYLIEEAQRARFEPSRRAAFLRLHLNCRTQASAGWLDASAVESCSLVGVRESLADSRPRAYGGLDLASSYDTASFVLCIPDEIDGERGYQFVPWIWIPRDNAIERERRDRVPYRQWAERGFVTLTDGNVIDYRAIRAEINKISKEFDIREIAYDPWSATQLSIQLAEEDGFNMIAFRQGALSYNEPCREFERLIRCRRARFEKNPAFLWQVANAEIKTDPNGNIRPVRPEHANHKKIDAVCAAVMALARALIPSQRRHLSVYERRGIVSVAEDFVEVSHE